MDQQRQSDVLPEDVEKEIRRLHLAMKQAFLYPEGHPIRATAAGDIYELLQDILSRQENHSLTAIEDKLYIDLPIVDQPTVHADGQIHVASNAISTDIAREFRRRGIRTVMFCRDMESWELQLFLKIMATRANEIRDRGGAAMLLKSAGEVPHIELVGIEYEDPDFIPIDDREDTTDEGTVLASYLRDKTVELTNSTHEYLSSLLQEPHLMARLLEQCVDYDGVNEPDSAIAAQCISRLISLEEQYDDEERKGFRRRLLEAILRMEYPVKNVLFAASDDGDILAPLIDDLSADEIAKFAVLECTTDGHAVLLRKTFDGLLDSVQESALASAEEQLVEMEAAIQSELIEMGQEDTFSNTIAPLLEGLFAELGINGLQDEQIELGSALDRLTEQKQEVNRDTDEVTDLSAGEDDPISFAFMLLEMLESETDYDDYADAIDQLGGVAWSMIIDVQDGMDVPDQCLNMALIILDTLSEQADDKGDRSPEWQECVRRAIASIVTEKFIGQVLSGALKAKHLKWNTLERLVRQMGEKAVPPLVEIVLSAGNSFQSQKLRRILVSIGPMALPGLREWLSQNQQTSVMENIISILDEIGGTEAVYLLSQALGHSDPQVRQAAISVLGGINTPETMELVLERIRDNKEHKSVKRSAISALGGMGNEEAIGEVERILRKGNTTLQQEAIDVLGNIGGAKSISILSDVLARRRPILGRRRTEELQLRAVKALGEIGTQPVMEVLLEMSQKKRRKVKSACDDVLRSLNQTG